MKRISLFTHAILLAGLTVACGGDDSKDGESTTGAGSARVIKGTSDSITIDFADAAADEQYVIMPYSLGQIGNVDGASDTVVTFSYAVKASGESSGLQLFRPTTVAQQYAFLTSSNPNFMDQADYDHSMRSIMRMFHPAKGLNQNPSVWSLARELDDTTAIVKLGGDHGLGMETIPNPGGLENSLRAAALMAAANPVPFKLAEGCPVEDDEIVRPGADGQYTEVAAVLEVKDASDFCLVYANEPVTESDKSKIEAAVTDILARYKTKYYSDAFADFGEYSFKPSVVIVDMLDAENWPQVEEGSTNQIPKALQVAGLYTEAGSKATNRPILYMASDLGSLPALKGEDDAKLKKIWYATLAHEMQHAISDYFVKKNSGTPETTALEEGIAHYMEDAFGYGEEIFSDRAKGFLDVFAFGTAPFLNANVSADSIDRGAAHAFVYYLSSQAGGVEATDGVVGGDGMSKVVDFVKTTDVIGPENLSKNMGGDWVETVGNYLAALALDGGNYEGLDSKYSTGEPVTGVKDLNGNTDKIFGMNYNGFGGVEDRLAEYSDVAGEDFEEEIDSSHYRTTPALYTVKSPDDVVTIEVSDEDNFGVTVVRVK